MPDTSPRALALQLLRRFEGDSLYSNLILDTALRRNPLSDADRGLLTALVYGVIERRLTLNYLIGKLSDRPAAQLDTDVLILLRMGIYQLRYMDRIPPHAALNETVALAPRHAKGFVNAVLRQYTRVGATIALPDAKTQPIACLSVTHSVPEELCARFADIFGFERADAILAHANTAPALTLRVNTQKTDGASLCLRLKEAGFPATPALHTDRALRLQGGNPTALPGFEAGEFFVQDEASILCTQAIDARPGMTVLDICACPGSKSFGMAIDMQNTGVLRAFDLHKNKLSLIETGAARLGLSCIHAAARDGRDYDASLDACADRVLCDVPCSGYGVLAKKPEIRYKSPALAAPLPDIQLAIAENAARYVKPGGVLLYSTCTLLPEENENNVARFLARNPAFSLCPFTAGDIVCESGMLTLTPDRDGTDGFFMAKLVRNNEHDFQ
jgi:16S rRNA (cytosine967-C5)-methyltransferase